MQNENNNIKLIYKDKWCYYGMQSVSFLGVGTRIYKY